MKPIAGELVHAVPAEPQDDGAPDLVLPPYTPEPATVLDQYAMDVQDVAYHLDAMATISLGERTGDGRPRVSRDGKIIVHGAERAPGLVEALKRRGGKSLIITFPFDRPSLFFHQRYVYYTATKLAAYGDDKQITVIRGANKREVYLKGTPEYERTVRECKVATFVYFLLAEWDEDGRPMIVFPDGYGYYRLRTTSSRGARNILSMINQTAQITRGRIAGIPFELYTKIENTTTPDGGRFNAPIWGLRMSTPDPKAMRLTSRVFSTIVQAATQEAQALTLEPPPPVSETTLIAGDEDEGLEVSDAQLLRVERGFNPDDWRKRYYAVTQGTPYRERPGRAWLIAYATGGATDSLKELLERADEEMAAHTVQTAEKVVARWRELIGRLAAVDPALIPPKTSEDAYDLDRLEALVTAAEAGEEVARRDGSQPLFDA